MKNIALITWILIILSSAIYAQDSDLTNDTLSIWTTDSTQVTNYTVNVKNLKSVSVTLKLRKTIITDYAGTENYFCWGPTCYPSTTLTSVTAVTIAAGATNNTLKLDFAPTDGSSGVKNPGVCVVNYELFDVNNSAIIASFKINYRATHTGTPAYTVASPYVNIDATLSIESTESRNAVLSASPNPASEKTKILYKVFEYQNSQIIIRNVIGQIVLQKELNKTEGELELSTENWDAGVYFYSIMSEDKISATKKLIITR